MSSSLLPYSWSHKNEDSSRHPGHAGIASNSSFPLEIWGKFWLWSLSIISIINQFQTYGCDFELRDCEKSRPPLLEGRGAFGAFGLRRFPEKARERGVFGKNKQKTKQNKQKQSNKQWMVTNYQDREFMGKEQRSPWFYQSGGGGGGGEEGSDRNWDNSDSFDKHVSSLIAFSH